MCTLFRLYVIDEVQDTVECRCNVTTTLPWSCSHLHRRRTEAAACGSQFLWRGLRGTDTHLRLSCGSWEHIWHALNYRQRKTSTLKSTLLFSYHRVHRTCRSVCTSDSPTAGWRRCANWPGSMVSWDGNWVLQPGRIGSIHDHRVYYVERFHQHEHREWEI